MKDPIGKVTAVEYDGTPSPKDGTVVAPQVPAKPNTDVKDTRTPSLRVSNLLLTAHEENTPAVTAWR